MNKIPLLFPALIVLASFGAAGDDHIVDVTRPVLSAEAEAGVALFGRNCSICHGTNGSGSEKGPPLIHRIYEPGHHADLAFVSAIRNGTRAHHWPYGDMEPVEGLSLAEIQSIITFVREVQVANGIE